MPTRLRILVPCLRDELHCRRAAGVEVHAKPQSRCRNRRRPTQSRSRQRTESGIPVLEKVSTRKSVAIASLLAETFRLGRLIQG
jgi:hypothetical protein